MTPAYFAALLALVAYTSSHIAEIVRASIQAVPRGQGEAADALALSGFQRLWYVVLPQAMRIGVPPIGNQYLNLTKNSSLAAVISFPELTKVTAARRRVPARRPCRRTSCCWLIYLAISLVISLVVNLVQPPPGDRGALTRWSRCSTPRRCRSRRRSPSGRRQPAPPTGSAATCSGPSATAS